MGCASSSAKDDSQHQKEEKNVLSASRELQDNTTTPQPSPPAQLPVKSHVNEVKEAASESIVVSSSQVRQEPPSQSPVALPAAPVHSKESSINEYIDAARKELTKNAGTSFESLYSCSKLIGHGAFAKVSICEHRSSKHTYAAKVVAKNLEDPAKQREGVIKEIAIMRTLGDHPNTVRLVDVFEESESYVLVMELCSGGELFDQIISKGHFSEKASEPFRSFVNPSTALQSDTFSLHIRMQRRRCAAFWTLLPTPTLET